MSWWQVLTTIWLTCVLCVDMWYINQSPFWLQRPHNFVPGWENLQLKNCITLLPHLSIICACNLYDSMHEHRDPHCNIDSYSGNIYCLPVPIMPTTVPIMPTTVPIMPTTLRLEGLLLYLSSLKIHKFCSRWTFFTEVCALLCGQVNWVRPLWYPEEKNRKKEKRKEYYGPFSHVVRFSSSLCKAPYHSNVKVYIDLGQLNCWHWMQQTLRWYGMVVTLQCYNQRSMVFLY